MTPPRWATTTRIRSSFARLAHERRDDPDNDAEPDEDP
jgi:hypothetical protein